VQRPARNLLGIHADHRVAVLLEGVDGPHGRVGGKTEVAHVEGGGRGVEEHLGVGRGDPLTEEGTGFRQRSFGVRGKRAKPLGELVRPSCTAWLRKRSSWPRLPASASMSAIRASSAAASARSPREPCAIPEEGHRRPDLPGIALRFEVDPLKVGKGRLGVAVEAVGVGAGSFGDGQQPLPVPNPELADGRAKLGQRRVAAPGKTYEAGPR
jgi:hypothetical protein